MNQKGESFRGKLTEEQKLDICRRLARFETPAAVHKALSAMGVTVRRVDIYKYVEAKKWKPFIAAARQEWVKGMIEIPLVHKRSRIEELVKLIARCERDKKLGDRSKRDEIASRLRQIQEEVDEKHTYFTNITANQFVGVTYEDLLQRRDALIERLKQYGGTNGGEVHRIGQGPVDSHDRAGQERSDERAGGASDGPQAGRGSGNGSDPQLPG